MAPEMHLSNAYTEVLILSGTTCTRKVGSCQQNIYGDSQHSLWWCWAAI